MNIRLSYNWLNEYLHVKMSPEEFAERISLHGPAVERVEQLDALLHNVVIGMVEKVDPHPNADKLKVARVKISAGKEAAIVCGGINLRKGMKVAVALPGAKVRWHGQGEPVALEATEIRGVKSAGMICAADELGLKELFPHQEREIVDLSHLEARVGASLAVALGFSDATVEFEVTTNRMDALSVIGLAREAAAGFGGGALKIFDRKFATLDHTVKKLRAARVGHELAVSIQAEEACHGYVGALVRGVTIGPSPLWLQRRLFASGIRPINNIVDITNYVMLEVGNPMHAFDAQKLRQKEQGTTHQSKLGTWRAKNNEQIKTKIVVRFARAGEKINALGGSTYTLDTSMLVITDGARPIAIAGIIGGEETGVVPSTTDIVLEAAAFDAASVRNTSRALNTRTESSARFEKGLSTALPLYAMARAVELVQGVCGGKLEEVVSVVNTYPRRKHISFNAQRICDRIGVELHSTEVKGLLTRLGFKITGTTILRAEVPWWRTSDIEGEHDIVEEIARLYGYHRIPGELPRGAPSMRKDDADILLEDDIKAFFEGAGFTEVISLSMVPQAWIDLYGTGEAPAVQLANPLSEDEAALRRHLTASHLGIIGRNAAQFSHIAIFEVARVFRGEGLTRGEGLPLQPPILGAAFMGESPQGELFFKLKGVLEALAVRIGAKFLFTPEEGASRSGELYHPGRSARVYLGGEEIGRLAEIHPQICAKFDIPHRVAAAEIDLSMLTGLGRPHTFTPLPLFPPVKRDIAFYIGERVSFEEIVKVMHNAHPFTVDVVLFDVYTGRGVPDGKKSMAFHVTYGASDRTLTAAEAEEAHRALCSALKKLGAEVR